MAQFYIPAYAEQEVAIERDYSPVLQQTALEMSVKKLYSIKQAQKSSHRQANLLKTVLVYNMFKAAVSTSTPETTANTATIVSEPPQPSSTGMDVDIEENNLNHDTDTMEVPNVSEEADAAAAAAEQSWFDRCIDKMLDEDDLEMDYDQTLTVSDSDSDSDESDSDDEDDKLQNTHTGLGFGRTSEDAPVVRIFDPTTGDPQECGDGFSSLKRSPSSASIQSYINSCQQPSATSANTVVAAAAQIDHMAIAENTTCQNKKVHICSSHFFTT
ncbi:hypothetical protein GGF40_003647 [Coemansia sp. RSA 1286]|nr:hypothetical protein GGF40_003647 [Coemansia sp. RSA 1286]